MTQFLRRRVADEDLHSVLLPEEMDAPALAPLPVEIDYLARQFGYSLLNVSPTDVEKLKLAVDMDDSEAIAALLKRPPENVHQRRNEPDDITIEYSQQSFFEVAVREFKTEWVEFFLKKIIDKSIPFEAGAHMIKHNFNALWANYRTSLEPILKKDVLGRDICTIQVPIETFTVEANIRTRIGTCNSITEWTDSAQEETTLEHWQSLNKKEVDRMMKRTVGRTVEATIRVFCFADICRVGLDGIIRFLLMTKAPSSVFKCPLIKSMIVFKWTRIWKLRALKSFLFYFIFLAIVNLTLLGISFDMFQYLSDVETLAFVLSVSVLMVTLAITTLWGEFFQLNTYLMDGKKINSSSTILGIKYYFSSRQNQIDLTISIIMLVFLPLYCIKMGGVSVHLDNRTLLPIFAFVVLLMWAKALYLAQAFERTGIFVLMIGRVLRECLPYFLLLFGFMVGFGFTMYIALLDVIGDIDSNQSSNCFSFDVSWNKDCLIDSSQTCYLFTKAPSTYWRSLGQFMVRSECHPCTLFDYCYFDGGILAQQYYECTSKLKDLDNIKDNFGTPIESILTMGYAMVGLFDPGVLLHCGDMSALAIAIFVLYLALQSTVMFNLLIAAMGDAFDGLRVAEEESFLMARAKFIDQYEALLGQKAIRTIEGKIGKYLYVLIPKDKRIEKSVSFWKGRMIAIKEDVRKIVQDSHEDITQKMERQTGEISQLTQNMIHQTQEISQFTQNINQLTQNINEMFHLLREDVQSLELRMKTLEERRLGDQGSSQ